MWLSEMIECIGFTLMCVCVCVCVFLFFVVVYTISTRRIVPIITTRGGFPYEMVSS
jgi:heme O synthase-like polyprenyltransferase